MEINQTGTIYFRGTACSLEALRLALAAEDRQIPMLIRADRAVALQAFVDVLGIIRELGFAKMSLQTEIAE